MTGPTTELPNMDGSIPSTDAFAAKPTAAADEVSKKLHGSVWERSELARGIYATVLSLGRWLSAQGVSPNALTYASLALAVGSGVAAGAGAFLVSAGLLLVSGAFDLLDGVVARAGHRVSRFGALLDSTVDRLSDALPLLGLVVAFAHHPLAAAILVLAMISGFAVSYIRARAEGLGARLPPLFMRRAERVVLILMALVVGALKIQGFPSEVAMFSILGVMGAASMLAAVFALRAAYLDLERPAAHRAVISRAAPTPSRP